MEEVVNHMQSVRRERGPRNLTFVKAIISGSVALLCLALLLAAPMMAQADSGYDITGNFNGISLVGALFSNGVLHFEDPDVGAITVTLPMYINALLVLGIVLVLAVVLFHVVAAAKSRAGKGGGIAHRIGGWGSLAASFMLLSLYILLMAATTPAPDMEGEYRAFYKVFEPNVLLLITGVLLCLSGMVELKIDAKQVKLLGKHVPSYLFMVLPLLLIAVFNLYPILLQTILSFKNYVLGAGVYNSDWVGLKNFGDIFLDVKMLKVIGQTLYISLLRLAANTVPPLILSVFLYDLHARRTKNTVQTIVYIPHFFSWVIIYSVTYAFLSEEGILNSITGMHTGLLNDSAAFMPIVIFTAIWKELGWGTILYLAALSGVPTELYEAAKLDGAGPLQRVFKITLPSIMPIIVYLLIMNLGNILKNAGGEQLLLFAGATTRDQALVIDTWLYWNSMGDLKYSLGAAMSFFQAAIGMILVFGCNYLSRKTTGIGMW